MLSLSATLQTAFDTDILEILPRRKRSYLSWLIYSFIPGSEVDINSRITELSEYQGIVLGFPKWTFSCPPLNRFISGLVGIRVPVIFLLMTCGGFDEERFIHSLTCRLRAIGCEVGGSLIIKRKCIHKSSYMTLTESFAKRIEKHFASMSAAD